MMKKVRYTALLLSCLILLATCQKNTASKIPSITFKLVTPDSLVVRRNDTCFIYFSFTDGDADIGNSSISQIYWKDLRFDSAGFVSSDFPPILDIVEDPKKGLEGTIMLIPDPGPIPRPDSMHFHFADTVAYEIYITDRAGNMSNHIRTNPIRLLP